MSAGEYLRYIVQGIMAGGIFLYLFYNRLWSTAILPFFVIWYLRRKKSMLLYRRREKIWYHFVDFLSALQSALRTGYSVENAVKESARELERQYGKQDPMVKELTVIQNKIYMNISVEQVFEELGRKTGLEDMEDFAEVLAIGKRTGGNLEQILEQSFWVLSEKIETQKEIEAAVAAKKYEFLIMSIVPLGIILYMRLSFSGFMDILYGNLAGEVVMSVCLIIYGCAWKMGEKITEIEV